MAKSPIPAAGAPLGRHYGEFSARDQFGKTTWWREVSLDEWDRASEFEREILMVFRKGGCKQRVAFVVKAKR